MNNHATVLDQTDPNSVIIQKHMQRSVQLLPGSHTFGMPLFWQVRLVNLSSDLEAEVFDVLCRYISCQSYCCWEGAKAKSRGEWEVRGQVMTFTVTVVYQVFLLSFCRIYCFFLQGMLSARICKSLVEDSVVCVCVFGLNWLCVPALVCLCCYAHVCRCGGSISRRSRICLCLLLSGKM